MFGQIHHKNKDIVFVLIKPLMSWLGNLVGRELLRHISTEVRVECLIAVKRRNYQTQYPYFFI